MPAFPPFDANRAALMEAARRLQVGAPSSSSSEDEGDQGEPPLAELFQRRYQELRYPGASSYFTQQRPTSNVMGAEYLAPAFSKDSWREQEIAKVEAKMTSQDRKRQVRTLMKLQGLHFDVCNIVALSPGQMPLGDVLNDVARDGQGVVAANWKASQHAVKDALDELTEEIKKEIRYIHLANDRGNKHGYGTIERMRDFERMEELVPKATMDLYTKAHASMNTLKSGSRGGRRGGKRAKKGKPSHAGKPKLAKCALCGGFGHVAGDANCKAVPRTQ